MNEIHLTSGKTVEFDKVTIHANGWIECKETHATMNITKSRTHFSPREVESIDESDEPDKMVTYR